MNILIKYLKEKIFDDLEDFRNTKNRNKIYH